MGRIYIIITSVLELLEVDMLVTVREYYCSLSKAAVDCWLCAALSRKWSCKDSPGTWGEQMDKYTKHHGRLGNSGLAISGSLDRWVYIFLYNLGFRYYLT